MRFLEQRKNIDRTWSSVLDHLLVGGLGSTCRRRRIFPTNSLVRSCLMKSGHIDGKRNCVQCLSILFDKIKVSVQGISVKGRVPGECQPPEKPSSTPSHIICSSSEGGPDNDEGRGKNKGRLSPYPVADDTNNDLT